MIKYKTLFNFGVNDINRPVTRTGIIEGVRKVVWICPYYKVWKHTIQRCLDPRYQEKNPCYKDCTICEEWRYLSNFIKWVDSQPNRDWMNCELDKDFLFSGNKKYSPNSCVFIPSSLNTFIIDSGKIRGKHLIGVNYKCGSKKNLYQARCRNPFDVRGATYIGLFPTELEAHKAWQAKKHEYACMLADLQEDGRVVKVLRERYAPDKDWTNK